MKIIRKITAALLFCAMVTAGAISSSEAQAVIAAAEDSERVSLIASGEIFGIKMFTSGVVVVGITDVETNAGLSSPANDTGLKKGDIITHMDEVEVNRAEDVKKIIGACGGNAIKIDYIRDGEQLSGELKPVIAKEDGEYKGGLWIKDSAAGVGTITYVNAEDLSFGGLGHGICDSETGILLPLSKAYTVQTEVIGIVKGRKNSPGQLRGNLTAFKTGTVDLNTDNGVFGSLLRYDTDKHPTIETALPNEVKTGAAKILCTLDDSGVKEYDIEITKVDMSGDNKNYVIKVTDNSLIEQTGGIVQGMSGSPIIQNGRLIGAVTHVLINEPLQGYGIYIGNMLDYAKK